MSDSAPLSCKSSIDPAAGSEPVGGRLIIISGPSGVGKNTVVSGMASRRSFHFSVSATTRAARPGESDGVDYHFIDREAFSMMIREDRLLEWAEFAGSRYGTPKEEVLGPLANGEDVVLDIEVTGAMYLMDLFPDAISIFVMPPSIGELEARMRGRRDMTELQISTRLALAEEQMKIGPLRFGHVVVNEDLGKTVDVIMRIIGSTVPEPSRRPGNDRSRCGRRPDDDRDSLADKG